jgi:hypothetical protein
VLSDALTYGPEARGRHGLWRGQVVNRENRNRLLGPDKQLLKKSTITDRYRADCFLFQNRSPSQK